MSRQLKFGTLRQKEGKAIDSERSRRLETARRKSYLRDVPNNQGLEIVTVQNLSAKLLGRDQVMMSANGSKEELEGSICPMMEISIGFISVLLPTRKPSDAVGNHVVFDKKSFLLA